MTTIQYGEFQLIVLLVLALFGILATMISFILGFRMGRVVAGKRTDVLESKISSTGKHTLNGPDIFQEAANTLESPYERIQTAKER